MEYANHRRDGYSTLFIRGRPKIFPINHVRATCGLGVNPKISQSILQDLDLGALTFRTLEHCLIFKAPKT